MYHLLTFGEVWYPPKHKQHDTLQSAIVFWPWLAGKMSFSPNDPPGQGFDKKHGDGWPRKPGVFIKKWGFT